MQPVFLSEVQIDSANLKPFLTVFDAALDSSFYFVIKYLIAIAMMTAVSHLISNLDVCLWLRRKNFQCFKQDVVETFTILKWIWNLRSFFFKADIKNLIMSIMVSFTPTQFKIRAAKLWLCFPMADCRPKARRLL